ATDEDLAASDARLRAFSAKLATCAPWISGRDVEDLRRVGLDDERILETVVTAALGRFLCTLADGLHPSMDMELGSGLAKPPRKQSNPMDVVETPGPYLRSLPRTARNFPPFAFLQEQLGFVPNLFRAQTLRPDILE